MKKILWESMLDAEMNVRYWQHLSRKYNGIDLLVKIFLVFTSSCTVLSWLFISEVQLAWKVFSTISASIALFHLFVNWGKSIEKCYMLQKEWTYIKNKYDILWLKLRNERIEDCELEQQYTQLKEKENDISYMESGLPYKKELIRKCQKEVLRSRGL